ncbi:MAG TPA: hypothetical protein VHE81_09395 [Lacipirellulaceae bacterium]|nr:hypothetical protein [Lacipirellulaceae bacterium]
MRVLRQIENLNAPIHVGIIGGAMALDVPLAALLLVAPLRAHTLVEALVDPTVELVDIHCVHALLEPVPFGLEPGDGIAMLALLVSTAFVERPNDSVENLLVDPQPR